MKQKPTQASLSIEQARAMRLQENAKRIEEGIINRICAKADELSESEFRDFAIKGIYEIIALRRLIGQTVYQLFKGPE